MDDINRVPGEEDTKNMENTLPETGVLNDRAEAGDLGDGPSSRQTTSAPPMDSGTGFGERIDSDGEIEGYDDTAGGRNEGLMDKVKDKYREIMNGDK